MPIRLCLTGATGWAGSAPILLAIRKVSTFTGLRRGLDTVLEL